MNADSGMTFRSGASRPTGGAYWRGCGAGQPWRPIEILAMVLGFIVFWPIGLAVLGWKIWQKNSGYPHDLATFAREKWGHWTQPGLRRWGFETPDWPGFGGSSGNRAFDEWRAAELARLEEERQRLISAEREFAEFMENLRHAKDREEFERFMNDRRKQQGGSV